MRNVPLSAAFDLTQGAISPHHPKRLLTKNNTFPRRAMSQSHNRLKHRGAKAQPLPSCSQLGVRSAPTPASIDRCSTPISELYRAIDKICGDVDKYARGFVSHAVSVEEGSTSCGSSRSVTTSPAPASTYESRRTTNATNDEMEGTVIYETGPKPGLVVDSIPAPHRGRGVIPVDARPVNTSGGKRAAPPPYRGAQGSMQVQIAPKTCRGDELVLLYRVPAYVDTLSQHSEPDPRSPLERRPRAALPSHTCCSLARRDTERTDGTTSSQVVRSQCCGARQDSVRAR